MKTILNFENAKLTSKLHSNLANSIKQPQNEI